MSKVVTKSRMQELLDQGQSVWLDYLRRGMLSSGELQRLIDDGLRGMTSNPTIFEHAIGGSTDYDEALSQVAASPRTDRQIFDLLAVADVRTAADAFRPIYEAANGADGFVSLEVSPTLARDTAGTIAEARRLWAAVDRPNVMIKVPGTDRKSTRLNSSHSSISYAVFCLKKKKETAAHDTSRNLYSSL